MKNLLLFVLAAVVSCHVNAQCGSPAYTEPQFTLSVQNPECPVTSEIAVTSASGGIAPYTYTLLPTNITNSTGTFSNLPAGTYFVRMKDACGTIRTRQATITPYTFSATVTMTSLGCGKFQFDIKNTASSGNLQYGYVIGGGPDTTWTDSDQIITNVAAPVTVHFIVKDECGNTAIVDQIIPRELAGYIKILNERIMCNGQEIYPEYYGFDAPMVCLYTYPQRKLVECKQAPGGVYNGGALTNFFDLPFGQDYYVIVQDGCYRDSMFFKDKTSAGGSELNPFAWHCNTFDLHSDGNNSGLICIYRKEDNSIVACKPGNDTAINPNTGIAWPYGGAEFYDLPYGCYYSYIYDPCEDTLVRIDTCVTYPRKVKTDIHATCYVLETAVSSIFSPETPKPWKTFIYWPNDSLVASYQDNGWYLTYPTYHHPGTIKVIQEDGCGKRDTSYLNQPNLYPIRTIDTRGGCPGITGTSGGGDVIFHGSAAAYGGIGSGAPVATVRIIKKDSTSVNIPQSYTQWNTALYTQDYYFSNLPTAVYIFESIIGCAGYKIYDTIAVKPYAYPVQELPHITQCGTNSFVFKDSVSGGVSPFTFEVLSTNPAMPALLTGAQPSNTFVIPPGASLDTITIRVTDYCGNAHVKNFPVNHVASCLPLDVMDDPRTESEREGRIRIFPNPSRNEFFLKFSKKKKSNYSIEVTNTIGITVYKKTVENIDFQTITINNSLVPGIYFIHVTDMKTNKREIWKHLVQ